MRGKQILTKTLNTAEMPKILYRTEEAYGSGVRDLKEILRHEIFELGNTDILSYTLSHYIDDKRIADNYIKSKISGKQLRNIYIDIVYIAKELSEKADQSHTFNRFQRALGNELAQTVFVESFLQLIQIATGRNIKYGLWLAERRIVETYYGGQNIDSYAVSDIILSDLGAEGILFAYTELPQPLENEASAVVRSQTAKKNEPMR